MALTGCDSSSGVGGGSDPGGSVVNESCTGEGSAVYVSISGNDSNPGTTADPSSIENNNIYNFDGGGIYSSGFYWDIENDFVLDELASGNFSNSHSETLTTPTGHNNITVNPQLDMTDLSPTGSSPASLSTGGQYYSSEFSDDFNGSARTVPWSIGAYESD